MTTKLTPRQIRERAAYEAEKLAVKAKPMTAADRVDFYRKQAGWPAIKRKLQEITDA